MRVLHLPVNIASQISVTVRALRDIGIDAWGLTLGDSAVQDGTGVEGFPLVSRREPFRRLNTYSRYAMAVVHEIARCDLVHWHYARPALPWAADLALARLLGKPGVVEFWGGDIRIPRILEELNPYYAARGPDYEYRAEESGLHSIANQRLFSRYGVQTCFVPELADRYVQPGLFRKVYKGRGRVIMAEFEPRYPSPDNRRPVLFHAPSAKVAKGTDAVLSAIDSLRGRIDFEFVLAHDMPHQKTMELMKECDVMLDQFVIGTTYGLAAIEAMAFGKPVVCYLMPSSRNEFPETLPVVNANPDNLAEILEPLIRDPQLRNRIGRQSRIYAELHHDAHMYAEWLKSIYEDLLNRKSTTL